MLDRIFDLSVMDPMQLDHLRQWRARLLALPPLNRYVDEARLRRHFFPLGAPDRD